MVYSYCCTCLSNGLIFLTHIFDWCKDSYVVDAADRDSVPISRSELHDLLTKPSLSGIPLLVVGNKIDKSEALSKQSLVDQLWVWKTLEKLVLLVISLYHYDRFCSNLYLLILVKKLYFLIYFCWMVSEVLNQSQIEKCAAIWSLARTL